MIPISIHAPREGSDEVLLCTKSLARNGFQSTLPVRGATLSEMYAGISNQDFNPRSP